MDEERVEYSFTGDVSSLRDATQQAISLLDKFEGAIKKAAGSNQFEASKTSLTSFQRTVNGLIKQTNTLASFMNKTSKETQTALTPDTGTITNAVKDIQDAFEYLQSSTKISTEDMKLLTSVLKDTRSNLDGVAARAQALGSSFSKVTQLEEQTATKTEEVSGRLSSASLQMLQKQPFVEYARQVDASFGQVRKSAEESMAVFVQAGSLGGMSAGIKNASDKLLQLKASMSQTAETIKQRFSKMTKVFDPITTKMQSFKDKAASEMSYVRMLADSVSSAFRRLASATDDVEDEASQAATAHKNLGKALQTTQSDNQALSKELGNTGTSFLRNAGKAKSFGSSMKSLTSWTNKLKAALVNLITIKLASWLSKSIKSSNDFIENLNLFNVAMGESADMGNSFVKSMSKVYGMDPSNLYKTAGYFYQLTDAIGMADQASAVLSLSMTKASNDIASLFNVDVQTVVDDLASGMQGMSRSVRKYGMDIRATALEQTALSLGIGANVETMSEANRMALRFITMMKQVKHATSQATTAVDGSSEVMGDFARTINQPANQLRILKEQVSQLARAIGNFFLPAISMVLPYINGLVMALRTMLTFIASLTGITESLSESLGSIDSDTSGIDNIGDAASEATKKLNKMLAPFDELNVLSQEQGDSESSSDDLLDPRLLEVINSMSLGLEDIEMQANRVRDSLLSFLGFKVEGGEILSWDSASLEQNLIAKFPQWTATIQSAFDNWSSIVEGFKATWSGLGAVADAVLSKISNFVGIFANDSSMSSWFESLGSSLESIGTWFSENADTVADFTIAFVALSAAVKGVSAIASVVSSASSAFSALAGILGTSVGTIAAVVAGIAAAIAAIVLLYQNSQAFASSFNQLGQTMLSGLLVMGQSIVSLFSTIWTSLQTLWTSSIQPMLEQTGTALAPVLDTIGSLFTNVVTILTSVVDMISSLWTSTLEPLFTAWTKAVGSVMEIFNSLWTGCLGPILTYIGDGLTELWTQYLSPVVSDIIQIIGGVGELLLNLWNTVLAPLVNFIVKFLGPPITAVVKVIWDVIQTTVSVISSAISVITGALSGIIQFLNGVFTGDWKRALSGLLNVFVSLGNGIIGILESVVNFGIKIVNSLLTFIVDGVKNVINSLGDVVETVAKVLGFDLDLSVNWTAPQIPKLSIPRIPKAALATGGVVTKPTTALIGEGKYDEAIIPLGNSPQMKELVAEIANAVNSRPDDTPVQVNVYIGDEQIAEYLHRAKRRQNLQTNGGY